MQLFAAFIVRRAHGLLPPLKNRKGSKGLRLNSVFQRKRPGAMGAGRIKGCHFVRIAKCLPVQLKEALIFAANVMSIRVLI